MPRKKRKDKRRVYICQYATICERSCLWNNNLALQEEERYIKHTNIPARGIIINQGPWPPKIVCSYDMKSKYGQGWIEVGALEKWSYQSPCKEDFHPVKLLKTSMYAEDLEDREEDAKDKL